MWICVIIYFGYTQSQDCCIFEEQTPAPFYFPISNARRPLFSHILTSMCYNVLPVIPILALLVMSCSIKKKKVCHVRDLTSNLLYLSSSSRRAHSLRPAPHSGMNERMASNIPLLPASRPGGRRSVTVSPPLGIYLAASFRACDLPTILSAVEAPRGLQNERPSFWASAFTLCRVWMAGGTVKACTPKGWFERGGRAVLTRGASDRL